MPKKPNGERLAQVAKLLRAERNPYYVRQPISPSLQDAFPCEGWYWIPPGKRTAELLARDGFDAYHRLMLHLEAEQGLPY